MSAAEAAYLIVLVGPGFLAMQLRAWTDEGHRISDAQRLTWSVLVSLPILLGLHGLLRHLPWKLGTLESPQELLSTPFAAPTQFILALYGVGAMVGWTLGRVLDGGRFNKLLVKLRLDPTRHRDVWRATFRENQWVEVHLKDGTSLFGWVKENSSGIADGGRFLRLTHVQRRSSGQCEWTTLKENRIALVGADAVSYTISRPPKGSDGKAPEKPEPSANPRAGTAASRSRSGRR